jgi:hypothetical protein
MKDDGLPDACAASRRGIEEAWPSMATSIIPNKPRVGNRWPYGGPRIEPE